MKPLSPPYPIFPRSEFAAITVLAIVLCQNPLTGSFAYEFSFFLGIAVALISLSGTSLRLSGISQSRPIEVNDFIRAGFSSLAILSGPLWVVLAYMFVHKTCRVDIGFAWFLLLPCISTVFGFACGAWGWRRGQARGRAWLWAMVPVALFSALTIRDLLLDPPLFFLHPAFGYFSGPIYDEFIPINFNVVSHRIWTLGLSFWMIGSALPIDRSHQTKQRKWALLTALLLCLPLFFRSELNWFHNRSTIEKKLGGRIQGDAAVLYYDPIQMDSNKAKHFHRVITFRVKSLRQSLGIEPNEEFPVSVFVYPTAEKKKNWTGARYTMIGNPIQRAVHLLDTDPRSEMLTHELAHVVAAPLGIPGLGIPSRVGLLEGLATALQGYQGNLTIHEWARAMHELDKLPDVRQLMSLSGFFQEAPARAYLAAGSFCQWLLTKHGKLRFRKLYSGEPFMKVYGRPLSTLISNWQRFLTDFPLSSRALEMATPTLMRKGIFGRECPHDVAAENAKARKCQLKKEFPQAHEARIRAYSYSGQTSDTSLGLAQSYFRQGRMIDLRDHLDAFLAKEHAPQTQSKAQTLLGDSWVHDKRLAKARKAYLEAQRLTPNSDRISVSARLELLSAKKFDLLATFVSALHFSDVTWEKYFDRFHPYTATTLALARVAIAQGNDPLAERMLRTLAKRKMPNNFARKYLILDAIVAEREGDLRRAGQHYWNFRKLARTAGDAMFATDQFKRLQAVKPK